MGARREPHSISVARRVRHPCDPVSGPSDDARPVRDLTRQLRAHGAAVCARDVAFARGHGRNERVAVDLPVRMIDRRADFSPAIFEHEHVLDLGSREQRFAARRPQVDDASYLTDGKRGERLVVLG